MPNHKIEPPHYTELSPQPIEVIEAWNLNFRLGNVIKYIARHKRKGQVEDLQKALWYLEREIQVKGVSNEESK